MTPRGQAIAWPVGVTTEHDLIKCECFTLVCAVVLPLGSTTVRISKIKSPMNPTADTDEPSSPSILNGRCDDSTIGVPKNTSSEDSSVPRSFRETELPPSRSLVIEPGCRNTPECPFWCRVRLAGFPGEIRPKLIDE